MRRLITAALISTLFGISNIVSADPPTTPDQKTSISASGQMPGAMINNIVVPYEVMVYVETNYPGNTVTEAREETRNGQPVFKLRVDSDTLKNDKTSQFLIYDKQWKLIGEQEQVAPTPPPPATEPTKPEEKEEDSILEPNDPRGGGDGTEEPTQPEPDESPVEEEGGNSGTNLTGGDR